MRVAPFPTATAHDVPAIHLTKDFAPAPDGMMARMRHSILINLAAALFVAWQLVKAVETISG